MTSKLLSSKNSKSHKALRIQKSVAAKYGVKKILSAFFGAMFDLTMPIQRSSLRSTYGNNFPHHRMSLSWMEKKGDFLTRDIKGNGQFKPTCLFLHSYRRTYITTHYIIYTLLFYANSARHHVRSFYTHTHCCFNCQVCWWTFWVDTYFLSGLISWGGEREKSNIYTKRGLLLNPRLF